MFVVIFLSVQIVNSKGKYCIVSEVRRGREIEEIISRHSIHLAFPNIIAIIATNIVLVVMFATIQQTFCEIFKYKIT